MDDELRFLDILSVLVRHEVGFVIVGGVHHAVLWLWNVADLVEGC